MNKNISEEKKKCEREFCDFLIQKITHAGGSLQFQYLFSLIQQARFEIRDAFGTTKKELMIFLKAHPKIFQIDSASIVTISNSPFSDDDTKDICSGRETQPKKISHSNIEKGIGYILRLHDVFGIIKATEPKETQVHFTAETFFNKKDCLLTNSPLQVDDEVYFNAVYGHDDLDYNDIKYSATKVWQKFDEHENSNKTRDPPVSNELNGQGIVKKLWADYGYISTDGLKNIFFHKTSIKDCKCDDLTQFLKIGDSVEFFATKLYKDTETSKWQATSVRKKSQNVKSSIDTKPAKSKLENEPGKIYPTSTGAIIKFGKNFTEEADGNSCSYFLYGGEVTDIKWEFSEGDEIFFDAEKNKSTAKYKWKALLAWVGDRPVCYNHKKTFLGNKSEVSEDESVSSSKASSISHSSKPVTKRSQSASKSRRVEQKEKSFDHSNSRRPGRNDEKFKKQTSKPLNSENFSTGKSRNGSERNVNEKDRSFVNSRGRNKRGNERRYNGRERGRGNERKFPSKVEPQKTFFNKNVTASYESDEEIYENVRNFEDHPTYKDNHSSSSQDDSNDDNQDISLNNKYLVTKRTDKSCHSVPRHNFSDISDNDTDSKHIEIKSHNNDCKKMASIKKFDDVEGKIVKLYCKAAFIECSCIENSVDFMLNAFYLNGKSVEEQQVIDLKEVIKVGDVIKFNCFEIIDDDGDIHKKVTMAWKGPKPEVYEMTPEEFIIEHDLTVTVNKELKAESLSGEITCPKNSLGDNYLKSTSSESSSESESEEEVSDDKDSRKSDSDSIEKDDEEEREENTDNILDVNKSLSETVLEKDSRKSDSDSIEKEDEEEGEEVTDKILGVNKFLSETVLERLKYKGLIQSDVQVDMSGLLTEVTNLVQKHCERCKSATSNEARKEISKTLSNPICPLCEKTLFEEIKSENDTAAQTIITGGIIAQSIYTQP